jgi:hypothetical protein
MRLKAEQEGNIVVAQLGKKRLPDGRVVKFTLAAKIVHQDAGGVQKWRKWVWQGAQDLKMRCV